MYIVYYLRLRQSYFFIFFVFGLRLLVKIITRDWCLVIFYTITYTLGVMRIILFIVIATFFINPLAATAKQVDMGACDKMEMMTLDVQHDCCEAPTSLPQHTLNSHNCDTCSDCASKCSVSCYLFAELSTTEPIMVQLAHIAPLQYLYPEPIQNSVIPPIA